MRPAALLALSLGGCFLYSEPIVQRPSIDIVPAATNPNPIYRGAQSVTFDAVATDPQHKAVAFNWSVYACTDGTDPTTCDPAGPFFTATTTTVTFNVPATFQASTPVQALRILVGARDTAGATTSSDQLLVVPVADLPPTLALRADPKYSFIAGTPTPIYAKVVDAADGPSAPTLQWKVIAPDATATYALDTPTGPIAPCAQASAQFCQYAATFTTTFIGDWTIEVDATDPLGTPVVEDQTVPIIAHPPPCLGQLTPIVPPSGDVLPISAATLFVVDSVTDDLDPYPGIASDPVFGAATFQWSIEQPGGTTHVAIPGATTNQFPLDPSTYNPGDIVELRVEVFNRTQTPVTCADGMATCSASNDGCVQRQTWRVEMR